MIMNTGLYIRVSTEDQAKEGFSIAAQKEKLIQYCQLKDWNIVGIYIDDGISGKNIKDRPQLNKIINEIKEKKINNILVYKLDRLTRSTKDLIELVDFFQEHNCSFNSLSEQIDTSSPTGRMFIKLLGIIAELERETIAQRISLGLEQKAKEGNYINTFGIYGYDLIDGLLISNENEKIIVNEIYLKYLDGWSSNRIAKELNLRKIPTKKSGYWRHNTIKRILMNSTYIGKVRYGTKEKSKFFEVDGKHKAIINSDLFYEVQKLIKKRKQIKSTNHTKNDIIFGEVLKCGLCNSRLYVHRDTRKKSNKTYISYTCYSKRQGICNAKGISENLLERAFLEKLNNLNIEKYKIKHNYNNKDKEILNKIEQLKKEINNSNERIKRLQYLLIDNLIETKDYKLRNQELNNIINKSEKEIINLNKQLNKKILKDDEIKKISDISNLIKNTWSLLPVEKKSDYIRKFIKEIKVINDNGNYLLDISYNI